MQGYFDETVDPIGKIGTSHLVLHGSHARLSNISDNDTWLEDEAFVFHGKQILRKAGASARGVLRSWVKLRREPAEARRMLEKFEIFQQPAAFVGSCDLVGDD